MAPVQGQASYKKHNGTLTITNDNQAVSWTPAEPPGSQPALSIDTKTITHLQQTPESSAKVMLKVFVQNPGQPEPVAHVFTFTSKSEGRNEANSIKAAITSITHAHKAAQMAQLNGNAQSAAMTFASAVSGANKTVNIWEDDDKLKTDIQLQQSLMKKDPSLQKTFMEALSMKPSSLSSTQFTAQFWSSRVSQLRAHAIAQSQGRGNYNVLSELQREDGGRKLNLTQEHVRVIFEQYPVVRTVYDEVVPAKIKDETDFWSKFFQSQLYMTLRGLKFDRSKEAKDAILDRYLEHPELTGARGTSTELHIPKFIDLEGNEENHSQRKGNRPDNELRQNTLDKAPIIRRLNALSEKIMSNVKPTDTDASAPIGMDEATYEQLRLRDLAGDPEQNRIRLNIRDQSRFFADSRSSKDQDVNMVNSIAPAEALKAVCSDFTSAFPHPGEGTIPIEDFESDDEDENDGDGGPITGQNIAMAHIISLTKANRDQTAPINPSSGLSNPIYERLTITHATTLEFLRQFWDAFTSGNAARANEIASLVESLKKGLDRIEVIATDAEKERISKIKSEQARAAEIFKQSGRKRVVDVKAIGGGSEVVNQLLGPLIKSVKTAQTKYKYAYDEQSKDSELQ